MKNPGLDRFPLGFWATLNADCAPVQQPEEWAQLGATLTMGHRFIPGQTNKEHFAALLESAYANGLRIILCDERAQARHLRTLGPQEYRRELQEMIKDWAAYPAIWGVHMGDEPNAEDYPLFIEAIHLLRELAPDWEPYANLLPWHPGVEKALGLEDWGTYLDKFVRDSGMKFLSYDCYTQMRSDPQAWPIYFRNLKLYGDAAKRNHIPFWTILLSVPHFKYRQPTLDDFRWQLNTAVAHGAMGISWFYLYQQEIWNSNYRNAPVNQLGRKTQSYNDISDVQNIFLRTLAPVLTTLTPEKVYHIGHAFGGFELFSGDEEVAWHPGDEDMILSYFRGEDGLRYIMVVNNSCTENVLYTLAVRGKETQAELLDHDGVWLPMNSFLHDDGMVQRTEEELLLPHWYAPGQALLYRILK